MNFPRIHKTCGASLQSIVVMAFSGVDDVRLLTSDQVMERLLSDAKLRRMAMTCVLPAVRCGNEWLYRKSDLDAWIAEQRLPKS